MKQIRIFDTTLRDGEQVPGAKLNKKQKLEVAIQLAKLGVDVIEAGFPISSPGDFEAVHEVAEKVKGPIIAGLARSNQSDIDAAWEAVRPAERRRIHVFLPTSDIHIERKLRSNREKALYDAVLAVEYAKKYCYDVEFSAEDATRSDPDYLIRVVRAVAEAGATVVNIPDTVGYATPGKFGQLVARIKDVLGLFPGVELSVHCHNDLGLAVANTLVAIENGADQVECTINGIGERAGNASLEEIVMILKTHAHLEADTNIITPEIYKTSRLVSRMMNISVQPNKAVVGANAFAHSSGIHQDGILKDRQTYEIMRPEDVGVIAHNIVLTARSGRAALRKKLEELGYILVKDVFERVYSRFISVADRKKEVTGDDLKSIIEIEVNKVEETFVFEGVQIMSGTNVQPMASVTLSQNGEVFKDAANGNGPVDAIYRCIDRMVGHSATLVYYDLKSVTEGTDALGEATCRINVDGTIYSGIGSSPDVLESSARAYLNAYNRYFANGGKGK